MAGDREARDALDRLASLASTIGTVRAAANVRRQRHRSELEALGASTRTLALACIAAGATDVAELVPATVARTHREVVIVMGQERGLCGDALDALWTHPLLQRSGSVPPRDGGDAAHGTTVVVVGRRAAARARALGVAVDAEMPGIVHPDGARALALDVLEWVLGMGFGAVAADGSGRDVRVGDVTSHDPASNRAPTDVAVPGGSSADDAVGWPRSWTLLYARPVGATDVEPVALTLARPPRTAPPDREPRWPGRGRPWHPVPRALWVPAVVRASCVHAILRAALTTLAAENALRSEAMERAERRAEELLEAMQVQVRRNRLQRMDEELRDAGSWRNRRSP